MLAIRKRAMGQTRGKNVKRPTLRSSSANFRSRSRVFGKTRKNLALCGNKENVPRALCSAPCAEGKKRSGARPAKMKRRGGDKTMLFDGAAEGTRLISGKRRIKKEESSRRVESIASKRTLGHYPENLLLRRRREYHLYQLKR